MKNKIDVWISVRTIDNAEDIEVFSSYSEIFGIYDYTEQIVISKQTYDKLKTGNYYAKRYGNSVRAYC